MARPVLLDLFCGAGGAAAGYHRAGFDVIGVDINPQPRYPFTFVQRDAFEYLFGVVENDGWVSHADWPHARRLDAVHASPPCQHYSTASGKARNLYGAEYPNLIIPTRRLLRSTGLPYTIENVANSPLVGAARLCGSSFGLDLRRHRYFETNWFLWSVPCNHSWQTPRFQSLDWSGMSQNGILASVVGVHGNCQYAGEFQVRCRAMGIDWMTNAELVEAIPPAYTAYIGGELMNSLPDINAYPPNRTGAK